MTARTTYLILLIGLISCLAQSAWAQPLLDASARKVIASGGNYSEGSEGLTLSATIGEVAVATYFDGENYLTQGFQQSNLVMKDPATMDLSAINESCPGAGNGAASIDFISENVEAPYSISWSNGATTSTVIGLSEGTYTVTVTGSNGRSVINSVTVGLDDDTPCEIHVFSGITPNGDGDNDIWVIDNIHLHMPNEVIIHSRSGGVVWSAKDYNNIDVVFDGTDLRGQTLPDATYYYIVKIDNRTYRGWLEITR